MKKDQNGVIDLQTCVFSAKIWGHITLDVFVNTDESEISVYIFKVAIFPNKVLDISHTTANDFYAPIKNSRHFRYAGLTGPATHPDTVY